MQHSCMMAQGPILMTRPVKPKPKNQFVEAAWGPRPPQIVFGFWLDRPGHQDGALGHHTGVLHDAPGSLFDIIQVISQFVM